MQPPRLPKKKDVALQLLEQATVYVHLDPRADAVRVPPWFKRQPQLVLQVGLNMPVPIPDLQVDDEGLSCTLSFNRSPFMCVIPWGSVFALVGDNRQGMIWPDDVPAEVQAQAAAQQAKQAQPKPELRVAPALAVAPAVVSKEVGSTKVKRAKAASKPAVRAATKTRAAAPTPKAAKARTPAAAKGRAPVAKARIAAAKPGAAKAAAAKPAAAKPAAAKVTSVKSLGAKPKAAPAVAAKARTEPAKAPVAVPAAKAPVPRPAPVAAPQPAAVAGGAGKRKLPSYLRVVK